MVVDFGSLALQLAARNIAVFSLSPGSKVPLPGSRGSLDASTNADVIRDWWAQTPAANIGVATGPRSGVWVLDVDPQHEGDQSLAEVVSRYEELPDTVAVRTPSGGLHLWWKWPSDIEIRNSAGRVGAGIDVRGQGGYVIAPPSRLSNGRSYRWVQGSTEILSAPDWLVQLTQPPVSPKIDTKSINRFSGPYCIAAIKNELTRLEQAQEGCRNDQLNRSAFAIARFVKADVIPEDWARCKLEERSLAIGLSAEEARRTIASAFSAAHNQQTPRNS